MEGLGSIMPLPKTARDPSNHSSAAAQRRGGPGGVAQDYTFSV